jgi:hypothetical protein
MMMGIRFYKSALSLKLLLLTYLKPIKKTVGKNKKRLIKRIVFFGI